MNHLLDLYLTFFRVGILTFGGGYAMLPILQKEVVEKKKWATEEQLSDYYAVGQCTPGIIAVNVATFCGHSEAKLPGAIFATLGVVSPSILIIGILASFLTSFAYLPIVQNAFAGLRVCVCVLIVKTIIKLWKKSVKGWLGYSIFFVVLGISLFTDFSAAVLVLLSGVAAVTVNALCKRRRMK